MGDLEATVGMPDIVEHPLWRARVSRFGGDAVGAAEALRSNVVDNASTCVFIDASQPNVNMDSLLREYGPLVGEA